ncbi:unnamed protein product [Orchesella dallaii]|uniref:Poly [ADP-ribose] polymerase n=1 Tax=Orchesella dallaii TaxID=48710 RepID=A0ABP1RLN2_9HEXA
MSTFTTPVNCIENGTKFIESTLLLTAHLKSFNLDETEETLKSSDDILSVLQTFPKLSKDSNMYDNIVKYIDNSQLNENVVVKLLNIYEINNLNVKTDSQPNKNSNRMLLWHGAPASKIASIIQNGLKKPDGGGEQRFGPGIYFADRVGKSSKYCCATRNESPNPGDKGFLLLCEVDVGTPYEIVTERLVFNTPPETFDCVKVIGKKVPDPDENVNFMGICIPLGKTVEVDNDDGFTPPLCYNEYVVYSQQKARVLYVVEFQFTLPPILNLAM